jgi:formiminotetrahydrofolate cyclodeaminase
VTLLLTKALSTGLLLGRLDTANATQAMIANARIEENRLALVNAKVGVLTAYANLTMIKDDDLRERLTRKLKEVEKDIEGRK